MNYNQNYYLLNKNKILERNKDYRVKTNYNQKHNNTLIKCNLCNKELKIKSLRYHIINNVCLKQNNIYDIIYQK